MRKSLWLLFFPLLGVSCGHRDLPSPTQPSALRTLEVRSLPEVMNPQRAYRVEIKLNGELSGVDYIQLEARRLGESAGEALFFLNDDGDARHPNGGDVVAGDGVFTQQMLWQPQTLTRQLYQFRFTAVGSAEEQTAALLDTVLSMDNKKPRLLSVEAPDYLPSGFDDLRYFRATAEDSNGIDDIDRVSFNGFRNDTLFFSGNLQPETEGRFVLPLDSSFAAGKKGTYLLKFSAIDRSGTSSNIEQRTIVIENEPPVIFDLQTLSEAVIPQTDSNTFLVSMRVWDPQGPTDIKFAGYKALRPDSVYANQGLPIPMVDNGLSFDLQRWSQQYFGDLVKGDGIYSITAVIFPTDTYGNPTLKGDYIWTFYAQDFANQGSNQIVHVITLK